MKIRGSLNYIHLVPAVLTALVLLSGCTFTGFNLQPAAKSSQAQAPAPEKVKKPTALYYDFEDVLLPVDLTIVKDRTFIVSTPGFKSGILTLKGRLDAVSLFNFFSANMEKDNWEVLSKIKSPEITIMVFRKTARCSVITIRDESMYTYVEIGVAPTLGGESSEKSGNLTY